MEMYRVNNILKRGLGDLKTKQEFIDSLRRALTGRIEVGAVEEHIRYYDEYITAEMRMGRPESEVLDELGEPRLIAMSICAASEAGEDVGNRAKNTYSAYDAYEHTDSSYFGQSGGGGGQEDKKDGRPFVIRHPVLTIVLILITILAVVILCISLAFSLLKVFWPAIVAAVIVWLVVRLIAYMRDN